MKPSTLPPHITRHDCGHRFIYVLPNGQTISSDMADPDDLVHVANDIKLNSLAPFDSRRDEYASELARERHERSFRGRQERNERDGICQP